MFFSVYVYSLYDPFHFAAKIHVLWLTYINGGLKVLT